MSLLHWQVPHSCGFVSASAHIADTAAILSLWSPCLAHTYPSSTWCYFNYLIIPSYMYGYQWMGIYSLFYFFISTLNSVFWVSLRDREVACSATDRQGSNFESCVWRTVSSHSSHHTQQVLSAQFGLYVHKGGLKPDSFHFISLAH